MRSLSISMIVAALLAAPWALAAQPAVDQEPGYLAIDELGIFQDEDKLEIEVTLHDSLIGHGRGLSRRRAARARRGAVQDPLHPIPSVSSSTSRDLEGVRRRTADTATRLEQDGWQRVVRIRNESDQSYLYLRWRGENIVGLTAPLHGGRRLLRRDQRGG